MKNPMLRPSKVSKAVAGKPAAFPSIRLEKPLVLRFDAVPESWNAVLGAGLRDRMRSKVGARTMAWAVGLNARRKLGGCIANRVGLSFVVERKRLLDPWNSCFKPWVDGLVSAGLLANDTCTQIAWIREEQCKGPAGRTELTITPVELLVGMEPWEVA